MCIKGVPSFAAYLQRNSACSRFKMCSLLGLTLIALFRVYSAEIPISEFQNDVTVIRSQEGDFGDIIFTKVSDLGDILLTPEQEEQARQGIRFDRYGGSRWRNGKDGRPTIPYCIESKDFTRSQLRTINSAISDLNSRLKKLDIIQCNSGTCPCSGDYVKVFSGQGCYSNLGRVGGEQKLSLQRNGCLRPGTIQHEFIHAAGFLHEHCRPDRDDYVEVQWDNIPSEWRSQYNKESDRDFSTLGPFEECSVMHYPENAPNSDKPAFEFLRNTDSSCVGQRDGATAMDVQKIDKLYS